MINNISQSLKKNIAYLIMGPTLKIVEAFFDLLIPLFMKAIIDLSFNQKLDRITTIISNIIKSFPIVNQDPVINYCIVGGIIILLMGLFGFVTTMVTQFLASKCASNVGSDIRSSLYKKVLQLNKKEIASISLGKIQTVINNDSYQVQQGVLFFIRLVTRTPFIIIGALVLSIILDYQIGLSFLILIPGISFIAFFFMKKSSKKYLSIQDDLEIISTRTSDSIYGNKVIKVFNKENFENSKFLYDVNKYKKDSNIANKYNSFINPLTFALVNCIIIFTLILGSMQMSNGKVVLGSLILPSTIITLVAYLDQIFLTVIVLTNLMIILIRALASSKRVNNILSLNPKIVDNSSFDKQINIGDEILSFDSVTFNYFDQSDPVLKDISFSLNKGESLGIIGSTGSGKSTVGLLMNRLIEQNSGLIKYKGVDIKNYSLNSLRNEISIVLQKAVLFTGTIKSNLLSNNSIASDDLINKVLDISLSSEFVNKYDDNINHEVKESGKNFSGGQRQRLSIARGLISNPEVLILDDSTSALDLISEKNLKDNINTFYPELTKVIISQRISTINSCDKILVLDSGRVAGYGTHIDLLKSSNVYKQIYDSQNMVKND